LRVYYNNSAIQFPDQKLVLGRYLVPTEPEVGSGLSATILTIAGYIVSRNTFRHLADHRIKCSDNRKERRLFDEKVGQRLDKPFKESKLTTSFDVSVTTPDYEVYDKNNTTPDCCQR
jgi:hypothetical protein